MKSRSILCIIAHPDDLELMAGGSVARWIHEGASYMYSTFTNGVWTSPEGKMMRDPKDAVAEEKAAAGCWKIRIENLQLPAMDLEFRDCYMYSKP